MASRATTGHKPDGDIKAPPPRLALSILDCCEAHGISEGMFYKLKKQGLTPREMKVGTRTLITFEAAADWRAEREAHPRTVCSGRIPPAEKGHARTRSASKAKTKSARRSAQRENANA